MYWIFVEFIVALDKARVMAEKVGRHHLCVDHCCMTSRILNSECFIHQLCRVPCILYLAQRALHSSVIFEGMVTCRYTTSKTLAFEYNEAVMQKIQLELMQGFSVSLQNTS